MAQLDLDRDAGPLLDGVAADLAGVGGGSAGDDRDAVDAGEHLVAERLELRDDDLAVVVTSTDRVGDSIRLFADLLGHEARPAALLGGGRIPCDLEGLDLDPLAVEIGDGDRIRRDRHDLVLTDRDGVAGVLDEGGDVGAEEVLSVAETDDERRVAAGADDDPRLVLVQREQGERTLETAHDDAERLLEAARGTVLAAEEDRCDLGVRLAAEGEALGEELVFQHREVLDDAVVDDGQTPVVSEVRMRVAVGRSAVRSPARVTDAGAPVADGVGLEVVGEHRQLAGPLRHMEITVVVDDRDTRGVVPPVFQSFQTTEEYLETLVSTDVPHDSTHAPDFSLTQTSKLVAYG